MKGDLMKRFTEINGNINFESFASSEWELSLKITQEDIIPLFMEIQLLEYKQAEALIIKSKRTTTMLSISLEENALQTTINKNGEKFQVDLSMKDLEMISSFALIYYRDTFAPVSHIHLDVASNPKLGKGGAFTIIASDSIEPMSGEVAKQLLERDQK